jgi:hypothetical protein
MGSVVSATTSVGSGWIQGTNGGSLSGGQCGHRQGSTGLYRKGFCGTCKGLQDWSRHGRFRLARVTISIRGGQMKAGQVLGWSPTRIRPQLGRQPLYPDRIVDLWHNRGQSRSAFDGGVITRNSVRDLPTRSRRRCHLF